MTAHEYEDNDDQDTNMTATTAINNNAGLALQQRLQYVCSTPAHFEL
jgi:hypothetical protein